MKRGIAGHPKTQLLAHHLSLPVATAVGILEMLCNQWAPQYAPRGDVGKWTDEQIARGLQCDIPGDRLVQALVDSGWLDRDDTHRLVIHDYHEHADEGVRKALQRKGETFAGCRDSVSTPSRHRLDAVEPPRAGTGTGTGSSSFALSSSSQSTEEEERTEEEETHDRTARARVWHVVPPEENLTASRGAMAVQCGVPAQLVSATWAEFADHDFKEPRRDVDRTWRTWCRNAVKYAARDGGWPTSPPPVGTVTPLRRKLTPLEMAERDDAATRKMLVDFVRKREQKGTA